MKEEILVTIKCAVYNHEQYLKQCLDGFVMQKTNFRFEVILHDDASSDSSAKIIREYTEKYPDLIIPICESENQYSKGGFELMAKIMDEHIRGKYIAICEGDDYWTDPYKLQKQVDYLESHPECGLVYTQINQFDQETQKLSLGWARQSDFDDAITRDNPIPTLTTFFRKSLYDSYLNEVKQNSNWKVGDFPLWLYLAYNSKIKCLDDITGVYRILLHSASHSTDVKKIYLFSLSVYDVRKYFINKYHREDLFPKVKQLEINDLFKLCVRYNKNLSWRIFKFAKDNSALNMKVIIKCLIYSTKIGRVFHLWKYK